MADDDSDDEKITLAQQIFGKKAAFSGGNPLDPKANDLMEVQVPAVATQDSSVSESSPPPAMNFASTEDVTQQRQLKPATKLAEMIELDLPRPPPYPTPAFPTTPY